MKHHNTAQRFLVSASGVTTKRVQSLGMEVQCTRGGKFLPAQDGAAVLVSLSLITLGVVSGSWLRSSRDDRRRQAPTHPIAVLVESFLTLNFDVKRV